MNPEAEKLEAFFDKKHPYSLQLKKLRALLDATELKETLKWGIPTYTINDKNVVGLGRFKNHYGVWFFQGVFLSDESGFLRNANKEKTKGMRQLNFKKDDELPIDIIKTYVLEAIQNQKDGKTISIAKAPKTKDIDIPEQLQEAFSMNDKLEKAFNNLTPGKQKEYANHISEAKRETTKLSRLEKITPMILSGKELYDEYK